MNFLIDQIKEQKILEMEVDFDTFIKDNNISESAVIHTMAFDKSVFVEEKEVREYLKDKYFYSPDITSMETSFVVALVAGNQIDIESQVEVNIRRGVTAFAADLLPVPCFDEIRFNDKGEVNLSFKFDTVNLNEGLPYIIEIARVAEGEHPSYGKLVITQEHLESMKSNFESNVAGVDLAVNEDHKKNEAFGWFKDVFLSFDKQTLYGQVKWNTKGIQALSEKEYRYFSPEFRFNYVHPHTGVEHGTTLLGGALTNYPFLKMEAITELNNKNPQGEKIVSKENTQIDLSIHNEKVVELSAKITEVQGKLVTTETKNVELSDKVKELETEIKQSKAAVVNEKLFTEGKINKAQLVALNEGKTAFEVLALGAKMNTEAKGGEGSDDGEVKLSAKEKKLAKSLELTEEEFAAGNK